MVAPREAWDSAERPDGVLALKPDDDVHDGHERSSSRIALLQRRLLAELHH